MSSIDIYGRLREHSGTSLGLGIPDDETHQDRLALAARQLRAHKAERLLDVGCGYGDLRLHVLHCRYLGIDAHDWMIDEARSRLPTTRFKTVRLEDFPADPARFDAVAALGVLQTVRPAALAATMDLLARQASRLLCVSFVPSDGGYAGRFAAHDRQEVARGRRVLDQGEAAGELTLLLDISR